MVLNPLQIREIFHLSFLRAFLNNFGTERVVLKGGVNLRLFFKSPRYSEDMDLDVYQASVASLQNQVMKALAAMEKPLKVYGITSLKLPDLQKAKQTETTQRFKVHLQLQSGMDLFTKIEFSRRGLEEGLEVASVNKDLLRSYHMPPLLAPHYLVQTALVQKIKALAGRPLTQARDVFDLYHLKVFLPDKIELACSAKIRKQAQEKLLTIDYETYRDLVVAYLEETTQKMWGTKSAWENIQNEVWEFLE